MNEEEMAILQKMATRINQRKSPMYKIEEGLWQGGVWDGLLPEEFTAVLTLTSNMPECVSNLHRSGDDKVALWVPIEDALFPGLKWLQMVVNMIEDMRDAGKTVYVHCRAGISRSTMVVAAYLMMKHGWNPDQAMRHITQINREADPNRHFIEGLKKWHRYLSGIGALPKNSPFLGN